MPAQRLLADLHNALQNGFAYAKDPGSAGTISFDPKGFAICEVVTAGAETRVLETAVNHSVGTELWVIGKTIVTSLTITGATNGSPVLGSSGELAVFVVSISGTTKVWKLKDVMSGALAAQFTPETVTALADTATVTPAQTLTKIIHGTPTAAATYTFPTAALLVAAMPGARVGDAFDITVANTSAGANTITVAAGSGGTVYIVNNTVAQNIVKRFRFVLTNVTLAAEAYNLYSYYA